MSMNAKNGPSCSICEDTRRASIDRRLTAGATLRALAGELGVSKSSLARHRSHGPERGQARATSPSAAPARPTRAKPARGKRSALAAKERDLVDLLEAQARRLLEDLEADETLPQRDRAAMISTASRTLQAAQTMRTARDEPREVTEAEIVAAKCFR